MRGWGFVLSGAAEHLQVYGVLRGGGAGGFALGVEFAELCRALGCDASVGVGQRCAATGRVDCGVENEVVKDDRTLAELVDDGGVVVVLGVELCLLAAFPAPGRGRRVCGRSRALRRGSWRRR